MTEAFEGLSGFRRIVDDIIIYDKDAETHMTHVRQFLQRCQERKLYSTGKNVNLAKWRLLLLGCD